MAKNNNPNQGGLFGNELHCPNIDNLPLITDPMGNYEVLAPGFVYQPILLDHHLTEVKLSTDKLNAEEEKFIRDLINRLYPDGIPPKDEKTPLKWGSKEIWIKRNLAKNEGSFRLRVDDSDWFYPDFIVWIIDHKNKEQIIGFVDPKGLAIGTQKGWADPKVVATVFVPHVLQRVIANQSINYMGAEWNLKIRGILVVTRTGINELKQHAKFSIKQADCEDKSPSEAEFQNARIIFQKNDLSYIDQTLALLTEDTKLDLLLQELAALKENPNGHNHLNDFSYDLQIRLEEATGSECELVGGILKDYLFDGKKSFGLSVKEKCRRQLINYSKDDALVGTIDAEKVYQLRELDTPC